MSTARHPLPFPGIDAGLIDDCIHCGLCLETCPTFVETGREDESPRGRLLLMHGLSSGRWGAEPPVTDHLDLCLGCRACETACPSGVQYGRILERTRAAVAPARSRPRDFWEQFLVEKVLWRGRMLARLAAGYRLTGAGRLARALARFPLLPGRWRRVLRLAPRGERPVDRTEHPASAAFETRARPRLFLLRGCMARALFPRTEAAMQELLDRAGYSVALVDDPECCGALANHVGARDLARTLGRALIDSLSGDAWVVTTAAGCGAHVKELHHLFAGEPEEEEAASSSGRVRDMSEALEAAPLPLDFAPGNQDVVAYQDPCHLRHAQGIVDAPRRLLEASGAKVVDLREDDLCCGSAGTYNLARGEMAERLGRRKADVLNTSGASVVVTANPGCLIQLDAYLPRRLPIQSLATYLAGRLQGARVRS